MEIGAAVAALSRAHGAVGDLPGLIARLQAAGLTVGTERAQHAAALLDRLAASGIALDDAEAALAWLAPVLCVTRHDREVLGRVLAARAEPREAVRHVPLLAGETLAAMAEAEARRPLLAVAAGAGGLALVVLGLALSDLGTGGQITQLLVPPGRRIPLSLDWLLAWLPLLAPVLLALLAAAFARIRQAGRAVALAPPELPPSPEGLRWYDEAALQGPLRMMGRANRLRGRRLDLVATLDATVARAGWPTLVRGGRPRTPEHVLLVQLASTDDPQRLAAAALVARLGAADLRSTAYAFFGRPDLLVPLDGGPALPLGAVAGLFRGARLLVMSDGKALFDVLADAPAPPPAFAEFALAVLLTPLPRTEWQRREASFARAGWQVFEQSGEALAELARWLSGPREERTAPSGAGAGGPDFAALLARDPRLFAADPPPAATRARLRERLADFLDPDPTRPQAGFDLLRALALGVATPPGVVARIAAHLDALGAARPDEATVRRLMRLPWFGAGFMPEWLRADLLRDLPDELARPVRLAWLLYLADQPVAAGRIDAAEEARLAEEAGRRLAHPATRADALMRTALAPAPAPYSRPSWRQAAAVAGTAALSIGMVWGLSRLGPVVQVLAETLLGLVARVGALAFGWMATLGITPDRPVVPVLAAGMAVLAFLPRIALVLRWIALGAALLLAVGPLWLVLAGVAGAPDHGGRAGLLTVGASQLVLGLLVLAALPRTAQPPAPARLLFVPGYPWANLAIVAALAAFAWAVMGGPEGDPATAVRLLHAAWELLWAGLLVLALGWRLLRAGVAGTAELRHASAAALAAQLAAAGAVAMLAALGAAPEQRAAAKGITLGLGMDAIVARAGFDLRLAAALLAGAWRLGVLDMRRTLAVVAAYLAVVAAALALLTRLALPEPGLILELALPVRLALAAWLARRPGLAPRWPVLGLLLAAALAYGLLFVLAGSLSLSLPGDGLRLRMVLLALPEWLLLWPAWRAMRPDLAPRSDGLWWRCLVLAACAAGFGVTELHVGPVPALIIPLAAWIATRHGMRALPAMAVALAFAAVSWTGSVGGIGLMFGGVAGDALAALLVARLVADRAFREASLAARRISGWQLGLLAVLPLGYASPQFASFGLVLNLWPLAIAALVLLGLSRVALDRPFAVLSTSCLVGFAIALVVGWPADPAWGRFTHGLRNVPGSLITIVLALGLARMLRDGSVLKEGAPLLLHARTHPAQLIAAAAPMALLVGLSLVLHADTPRGQSLNLMPFFSGHLNLLAFYCAAAGLDRGMAVSGRRVPFAVLAVAAMQVAAILVPGIAETLGPVQLVVAGGPGSMLQKLANHGAEAVALVGTVWAFDRLGLGIRRLMPIAPQPEPPAPAPQPGPATAKAAE